MKTCLIVCGHLAALKTTVSQRLSHDLKIPCLNKDTLKETLVDTIGFSNREENLKLSLATFELMKFLMVQWLETQDLLILESNFKPHEIDVLKKSAEAKHIHLVFLFLTGEPHILYERYVQRQPHRHPAHTSVGLMTFETFVKSMAPFDFNLYGPNGRVVDTTKMDEIKYQEVLNQVRSLMQ